MAGKITIGTITYDESEELRPNTNIFKGSAGPRKNVAIKRIFCENLDELEKREKEVDLWVNCDNHENVVKYHTKEVDNRFIYLASELCLGNLQEWMNSKITDIPLNAIAHQELLCQITRGVANLHSKGIIHRKIKPSNLLLTRNNQGEILAKIADFEVSRQIPEEKTSKTVTTGPDETKGWQAAEILNAQTGVYNPSIREAQATDIFSLGCIFYYVLTGGNHPFGDEPDRNYYIKKGITVVNEDHFKNNRIQIANLTLLRNMIAYNLVQRPTLDYIIGHHIFWSHERMLAFIHQVRSIFEDSKSIEIKIVQDKIYGDTSLVPKSASHHPDGWLSLTCRDVQSHLKSRNYCGNKNLDLYRAVNNLRKHIRHPSTPKNVRDALAPDYTSYWLERFPFLISTLWSACRSLRLPSDPFEVNGYY